MYFRLKYRIYTIEGLESRAKIEGKVLN